MVNAENLELLRAALKEADVSRLSIVSLTGSFRTGKSFMLSLMGRFLRFFEGRDIADDDSWAKGATMGDENSSFDWRPGVERHTVGIWVDARPHVRIAKGSRVGILLMDTQGLWDGSTGYSLLTSIFGMSSIISSLQIYNLMRTVELDKLDQIKWFTGFGASAMRQCSEAGPGSPAFQSLHLMVRDWVGFQDAADAGACREENRRFLEGQRSQSEFGRFFANLEAVYLSVDSVLLPPPGAECCFGSSFRGDLSRVDPAFISNATAYFSKIFSKPIVKQFNGNPMTPDALVDVVTRFADIFGGSEVPTSLSFAGAMEKAVNTCARETAVSCYRDAMCAAMADGGLDEAAFEQADAAARARADMAFSRAATYGDRSTVDKERERVCEAIAAEARNAALRNERQRRCGLNHLAPYVAIAAAAAAADKASDVLCDWWLPLCEHASDALLRSYVLMAAVMLAALSHFAFKNGAAAFMQALVELGTAVAELARNWRARVASEAAIAA